ncbi:HNH endonuclease [Microvirga makkahensis]|uniref:HNH nuclease domain-containing protein n=1 Tax=Microvirga makkahensis TaxID=1128670 RepID=A0A7X3SQN6_9HYPH|nr:HNH endonuclease [Microvirga makkahensis]MXQ13550.1 hypothetical protein [Microvirga makkahensis]
MMLLNDAARPMATSLMSRANEDPLPWITFVLGNFPLAVRHPDNPEYVVTIDGRVFGPQSSLKQGAQKEREGDTGYRSISFPMANGAKSCLLHRVVVSAFLGVQLLDESLDVNHLDGRKDNNFLPNLVPCTPRQNAIYNRDFGLAATVTAEARMRLAEVRVSIDEVIVKLESMHDEITRAAEDLLKESNRLFLRFLREREGIQARIRSSLVEGPEIRDGLGPCWVWTRPLKPNGYGTLTAMNVQKDAHAYSYYAFKGTREQIRDWFWKGVKHLDVCHECDVRHCVNPDHLNLGTRQENVDQMTSRGRKPLGPDRWNTVLDETAIREIRWMLEQKLWTQPIIADLFGVSQPTIAEVKSGRKWGHVHGSQKPGFDLPLADVQEGENPRFRQAEMNGKSVVTNENVRLLRYMKASNRWSNDTIMLAFPHIGKRTFFGIVTGRSYSNLTAMSDFEASSYLGSLPPVDFSVDGADLRAPREAKRPMNEAQAALLKRMLLEGGWRRSTLARHFGITETQVSRVALGKVWSRLDAAPVASLVELAATLPPRDAPPTR